MAIQRILPDDIETFSLQTHPTRHYASSSTNVVGKLNVFPRRSLREKEVVPLSVYSSSFFSDIDLNRLLRTGQDAAIASGSNTGFIQDYLTGLNAQQTSARLQQQVDIVRFTPGVSLDDDALRKSSVLNCLYPFYRTSYPTAHFDFTNYHSLNFFTGSSVPSGSALLYSNPITTATDNTISGPYVPSGAFSFDFWINPRYTTNSDQDAFKTGTILHLSSCYAVSLVSGSSRDGSGIANKYRLLLQLSNSADISPSHLSIGSLPQFAFVSDDNCLTKNNWHHVTIRWGSSVYNQGSGSFVVDGTEVGSFAIPSASIIPKTFSPTKDNPTVLCVGNYYEGLNAGSASMAYFFSTDTHVREGLEELIVDSGFAPLGYSFSHPLNAEIHDLKIYGKSLTTPEIATLRTQGPVSGASDLLFYLPPFFTKESPVRSFHNGFGGVLETPFYSYDGTTDTPFAVGMAFSVGGHYTNLENYTREFVRGAYPRLWELSGSTVSTTTVAPATANELLYATSSVRKRSLSVLPCDNGTFYPNFSGFLGTLDKTRFKNDLGNQSLGSVSLRHIIPTGSLFQGLGQDTLTGSLAYSLQGATPGAMTLPPGEVCTVLQRTRDDSSNQIVFFDISNLYYGDRIQPGTFTLTDPSMSGLGVRMTIKDDGEGNLYRADASGSAHATWSSVGNIFYNEGIAVLKDPQLFFFGQEGFSADFKGDRNIHVLHFNLSANPYEHVSSSNPSYLPVSASDLSNDNDKRFAYVTGINIHDDNLNVIMRTTIAQPIVLRSSDRIMFKPRMDF